MKHFNKRIIVLLSMLSLFFGSCFNTASAKLTSVIGEAICKPSASAIQQAKASFNEFKVGLYVDLSPASGLTKTMRVEKTIGKVHGHTVLKAGFNFDTYLNELRGLNATAGKTFEESFRRSFNNMMTRRNGNYIIEATAALGNPHDSADLLVINKLTGNCELKIQQKLSASAAKNAILHPDKYKDCVILTSSDQLEHLKNHLPKNPVQRKMIEDAIASGKLTDNIYGVQAKSMEYYQEVTTRLYRPTFNKTSNELLSEISRAIREGKDFITIEKKAYLISDYVNMYKMGGKSIPEIDAALRSAQFAKFVRVGNTVVGIAGSVIDIGYGVYLIYNAETQFQKGLLDADLSNYKKTLGVVQIGVGVVGLVMLFSPDPFSKIAAPIVVVVGVLVAALDMWIDYIQAQRVAARQRMIDRIEVQDRPRAIRQLLIREMNIQCAL